MKITKFVHSCLLIESNDKKVLIDPGEFSFKSGLINLSKIGEINQLVITHEHFDHFHPEMARLIIENFPEIEIVTTLEVAKILRSFGAKNVKTKSTEFTEIFLKGSHAPLSWTKPIQNISVNIFDRITHPGDRHDILETKEILALPVTAPWGSMEAAAKLGLKLKPKYILPIHDWHWRTEARLGAYDTLQKLFAQNEIEFVKLNNGESIEL